MSSSDRLKSARDTLGGIHPDAYSLFEQQQTDKHVTIWQPTGKIESSNGILGPTMDFKHKAEAYLELAVTETCHLSVAPELAYDLDWVLGHMEYFFADDSPLFVLGCSPVSLSNIEEILNSIEDDGITVEKENLPELPSKEYVTPTIIPIKPAARRGADEPALLVQFKNQPMAEGCNNDEHDRLACGSEVWKIDPPDGPGLAVVTCSDAMDHDLCNEITQFARSSNMIVHVQCNPKPFDHSWTSFRTDLFNGNDNVAYICANWGAYTIAGEKSQCGYSGAYIKGQDRSSLDRYDETYENGGLQGTKSEYYSEYLWMMVPEGISRISFKRKNPATSRPGHAQTANPHISTTWIWKGENYTEFTPGIVESNESECEKWQEMFSDSRSAAEVFAAICFGNIVPMSTLNLAALESLCADERERLDHFFAAHDHRNSSIGTPGEKAVILSELFDYMDDWNVEPNEDFGRVAKRSRLCRWYSQLRGHS